MGFSHMLFVKYCASFLTSFVSLPLIKNLAAMLCRSKPTGTLFEIHLRNWRHRERLGRVCGGGGPGQGRRPWQQRKTPKGDTENTSWGKGERKVAGLEEELNN